jgi:hypothetical protein
MTFVQATGLLHCYRTVLPLSSICLCKRPSPDDEAPSQLPTLSVLTARGYSTVPEDPRYHPARPVYPRTTPEKVVVEASSAEANTR